MTMKKFACGDVVPGCDATFKADSVSAILSQVRAHSRDAHNLSTVPQDLIDSVTAHIH